MRSPTYSSDESLLALVLLGGLLFVLFDLEIALWIALFLGAGGLLSKQLREGIHKSWVFLSQKLGAISSFLLLALLFFLILSPLAWIRRLIKSADSFHPASNSSSNFEERNHIYTPEDFNKPW
ncbi:MAG: SxtJ family membrane protein [Bacteroidia bacterium]|nr:SxtJ family membrane protein [Bacteroidia bacterium]